MAPVLAALQRYAAQVADQQGEHPLVGSASLSVGRISGGTSVNTVPDHCEIEIDRRLVPSESPAEAWQDAKTWLADQLLGKIAVEHGEPMLSSAGLSDDANGDLADRLCRIARPIVPECRKAGVPYGTNAPCYAAAGIPTVVFGPGSIEQAHTADEWVAVDQLQAATEILYRFATA